jgi:hypothetical protein
MTMGQEADGERGARAGGGGGLVRAGQSESWTVGGLEAAHGVQRTRRRMGRRIGRCGGARLAVLSGGMPPLFLECQGSAPPPNGSHRGPPITSAAASASASATASAAASASASASVASFTACYQGMHHSTVSPRLHGHCITTSPCLHGTVASLHHCITASTTTAINHHCINYHCHQSSLRYHCTIAPPALLSSLV